MVEGCFATQPDSTGKTTTLGKKKKKVMMVRPSASECFYALAMSSHPRLGVASPARHLSADMLERIADFVVPKRHQMKMILTYYEVHCQRREQEDEPRQDVIVKSRWFQMSASLFLLPDFRRVQRLFEDLRFKVVLQEEAGNIVPNRDEDGTPALLSRSYFLSRDRFQGKDVRSCGRFCKRNVRTYAKDFICRWNFRIREDVAILDAETQRPLLYRLLILPLDEKTRVLYPLLSGKSLPFRLL
jgi:hypothetical protein